MAEPSLAELRRSVAVRLPWPLWGQVRRRALDAWLEAFGEACRLGLGGSRCDQAGDEAERAVLVAALEEAG